MSSKLQNNKNQVDEYQEKDSFGSSEQVQSLLTQQQPDNTLRQIKSSDDDEEVDPFGDDQQHSQENELSLPQEDEPDNSSEDLNENPPDEDVNLDDSLNNEISHFDSIQKDVKLQEIDSDNEKKEGNSPSFASEPFKKASPQTLKNSQKCESPLQEKIQYQKRTSLLDKMNQLQSPDQKNQRILNPSEIRMLGMSSELRKSLLRQNGWDNDQRITQFGSPDLSSKKSQELLKSEQKLITRAKREQQVAEFEAEAKEQKRKKDLEQGVEPKKKEEKNKGRASVPGQKRMVRRLIFNTFNTNYPVIDLAAKNCGFRTVFKDHNLVPSAELKAAHKIAPGIYSAITIEEFDVVWFDLTVQAEVLQKIKPHQRLSQWPGISVLSHKNKLAKNLMMMQKQQPQEYNFFPQTFLLPSDLQEFKKQLKKQSLTDNQMTFIVKPSHDCQGRGIYLMKQFEELKDPEQSVVAQTYIDDPYLIDGLKFDLRMYVLLSGIHPLRIYLFDDGLARFATNPYVSAKDGDINDLFMHLTNYAINKLSSAYVQNEESNGASNKKAAHKRSLKDIYKQLESQNKDVEKLKRDINDLIVKTIITGQNHLHHIYRSSQPDDLENQMCFQVLGFDIMFDSKLKPWLIEINQSPSFATDSAFDFSLKKKVMEDTFKLLNLSSDRKGEYIEAKEKQYLERMTVGRNIKPTYEQKEYQRFQLDKLRDEQEKPILAKSGYQCIFPIKDDEDQMRMYNAMLKLSKQLQDTIIYGKNRKPAPEDNVYDIILKAQSKGIPDLLPQQRPKTATVARSKTTTGKKPKYSDDQQHTFINVKGAEALNAIRTSKEESKMKEKIIKNQIIQNVKRKALEQEKMQVFKDQLKEFTQEKEGKSPIQSVLQTKKQKENGWKAPKPSDVVNQVNRDQSKTPIRTKTPQRTPTVVRYQDDLSNPYTKNIVQKAIQPNPYVPKEKDDSERQTQVRNKPNLTPLSQLRDRAKQSQQVKNKDYNPVLADRKDRTPVRKSIHSKKDISSDESDYSAKKSIEQPHSIVNKFLIEKGIIKDKSQDNAQQDGKRYIPIHKRNKQTTNYSITTSTKAEANRIDDVKAEKEPAVNNFMTNSKQPKSPQKRHQYRDNQRFMKTPQKDVQSLSEESDKISQVSLKSEDETCKEVNEQINRMISSTYQAESVASPQPKQYKNKDKQTISPSSKAKEELRSRQISAREKVARHKQKLNKLKEDNRKNYSAKMSDVSGDKMSSKESNNDKTAFSSPQPGLIMLSKKKPVIDHNPQANVVDIEIIPPPKTVASKKSKRSMGNKKSTQFDDSDYEKSLKSPLQYTNEYIKQKSVLKPSDTVSRLTPAESLFKMNNLSDKKLFEDNNLMSQSLQVLPKKKSKPSGPPMYERRDSLANKSMVKSQMMREMKGFNERTFSTDQTLNFKSGFGTSPVKSLQDSKKKDAPKKEKLDPSKDFMAKNLEKLAKLQKDKEKEKKEELKRKSEEKDIYAFPTKKDKDKLKDEKQKKENQMIAAKLKFLKLIEDLKSKGKDPVFNLVKDFTINSQIGQGTFAIIKKCTHNKSKYEIALKTYDKKLLTRKSQLMAIHREIYILAGLEHPNIMKLFEVIDTKSHVNLVQEYCHGHNLYDYIKKNGQKGKIGKNSFYSSYLSEGRAKNIFRQISSAITYMHGLGLVHRDLRIENILINDQTHEIKFIDFGFATSFQQNDKLQMIGGVAQYKNPEVAKTKTLNGQIADTYALAIILYIMLTGGVPVWANYDSDLYQQVTADKMMLPVGQNAYTGQQLEIFSGEAQDLIGKMFQAETKNRMKASDILKHPWLGLSGAESSQLVKSLQNQSTQSSNENKA